MEFSGFTNSDFDFFKKKSTMSKMEYDERKEEIKRSFREFCYEIQKNYHSSTGGTLLLDKNFQTLNRNKNYVSAISKPDKTDLLSLKLELCQDNISLALVCPPDADSIKFERLKQSVRDKQDILARFFKENKSMFIMLYKRNSKKSGDDLWNEEFKFSNNELILGNYDLFLENLEKLQPQEYDSKKLAGLHIKEQFLKVEAIRMGKMLSSRVCSDIIKLMDLQEKLR